MTKGVFKNVNGMRSCSICGEIYPATTEFFHRANVKLKDGKTIWTGLRPECKVCRNQKRKEKYALKKRYCPEPNCNRELEKGQHFCSECSQIRRDIANIIHNHTYEQKPERIESKESYQKQYRKDHAENHKQYMKDYHKNKRRTDNEL